MDAESINIMTHRAFSLNMAVYDQLSPYEKLVALTDIINWASLERSLVGQTPVGEVRRGTEVVA